MVEGLSPRLKKTKEEYVMSGGLRWQAGCVACAVILALTVGAYAQGAPKYNNLRFDEDWSQFPDEGVDSLFDPIKKIDISDSVWMSMGGEYRFRSEYWDNFGFVDANDDTFVLNRFFLHTDWHFGDHWRLFLQGKATLSSDRALPGGERAALDVDEGDVWNTFIQGNYSLNKLDLMLRLGRQELQYGAQRLISPLEWANNRRIFDGGVLRLKGQNKPWQLDIFSTIPVAVDRKELNEHHADRLFSGLYYTQKMDEGKCGFDAYLLALNDIDDAAMDEDRFTLGGRIWGSVNDRLSLEGEVAVQFGEEDSRMATGNEDILAWMIALQGTYTFKDTQWTPFLNLGLDISSGDDDPTDGDTETFRHLFPLGHAYNGFIDAVGRQNIIDLHGSWGAWPVEKRIRLKSDIHFFWLTDDDDALYHAGGGVVRPGGVGEDEVGMEIDLTMLFKFNKHTSFLFGYSHFSAGDFIEDTGSSDSIDFMYSQMKFVF
jgi:hypothetical protein